jgi:hypothetical protein
MHDTHRMLTQLAQRWLAGIAVGLCTIAAQAQTPPSACAVGAVAPATAASDAKCSSASACQPGDKLDIANADQAIKVVTAQLCLNDTEVGPRAVLYSQAPSATSGKLSIQLSVATLTAMVQSGIDKVPALQHGLAAMSASKTIDVVLLVEPAPKDGASAQGRRLTFDLTSLWSSGALKPALHSIRCGQHGPDCVVGDDLSVSIPGMAAWLAPGKIDATKLNLVINGIPFPALPKSMQLGTPPPSTQEPGLRFTLERGLAITPPAIDPWATLFKSMSNPTTSPVSIALATDKGDLVTQAATINLTRLGRGNYFLAFVAVALLLSWGFLSAPTLLRDTPPIAPLANTMSFSLGRCQMFFWTVVVAVSWACLWYTTGTPWSFNDTALMLMGIASATALGASANASWPSTIQAMIDDYNKGPTPKALQAELASINARRQALFAAGAKPTDDAVLTLDGQFQQKQARLHELQGIEEALREKCQSVNLWADLTSNVDDNQTGLHRVQNVLFTVLLGVAFLIDVVYQMTMPYFPAFALALMGISGTAYVGYKFAASSSR